MNLLTKLRKKGMKCKEFEREDVDKLLHIGYQYCVEVPLKAYGVAQEAIEIDIQYIPCYSMDQVEVVLNALWIPCNIIDLKRDILILKMATSKKCNFRRIINTESLSRSEFKDA